MVLKSRRGQMDNQTDQTKYSKCFLQIQTFSSLAAGPLTFTPLFPLFPVSGPLLVTSCLHSGQIFFIGSHLSTHCVWNSCRHGSTRSSSPSLYSCMQMAHEGP